MTFRAQTRTRSLMVVETSAKGKHMMFRLFLCCGTYLDTSVKVGPFLITVKLFELEIKFAIRKVVKKPAPRVDIIVL